MADFLTDGQIKHAIRERRKGRRIAEIAREIKVSRGHACGLLAAHRQTGELPAIRRPGRPVRPARSPSPPRGTGRGTAARGAGPRQGRDPGPPPRPPSASPRRDLVLPSPRAPFAGFARGVFAGGAFRPPRAPASAPAARRAAPPAGMRNGFGTAPPAGMRNGFGTAPPAPPPRATSSGRGSAREAISGLYAANFVSQLLYDVSPSLPWGHEMHKKRGKSSAACPDARGGSAIPGAGAPPSPAARASRPPGTRRDP